MGDDIEIRLGVAAPQTATEGVLPEADPALCVRLLGMPGSDLFPVYIKEGVLREVEGHAAAFPDREVGGVLVGRRLTAHGKSFVLIEQCIRGLKAEGVANRLTFTHDTWVEISAIKEREFPSMQIVGWYHTHPGLGVFLSRDDQYIHHHFFREDWQVALVVDASYCDRGLFIWKDGGLVRDSAIRIYQPAGERQRLEQYVEALSTLTATRGSRHDAAKSSVDHDNITVKINFREATISPFSLLPAGIRRFFGIDDLMTAPRISVKTLCIIFLLLLVFAQGAVIVTYSTELRAFHNRVENFIKKQESHPAPQEKTNGGTTAPGNTATGGENKTDTPAITQ